MVYNRAKRKMKKNIIVAFTILSTIAFFAFTTPTTSNTKSSKSTTISMSYVSTVSVCKITGDGINVVNCSFTGRYDDETGYITIYNSKNKEVASGKVRVNNDTRGKRKNYSHCLQNTYFFNV